MPRNRRRTSTRHPFGRWRITRPERRGSSRNRQAVFYGGPIAFSDFFAVDEDTVLTGNVMDDNGAGPDGHTKPGHTIYVEARAFTSFNRATVVLNEDGTFSYTPYPDWYGSDYFQYTLVDDENAKTIGAVIVIVNPINDPPNATDDTYQVANTSVLNVNVLSNDFDVEGSPISAKPETKTSAKGGNVVIRANGVVTFTPPSGYVGSDSFTYTVTDGELEANGTVTINVTGVAGPSYAILTEAGDYMLSEAGDHILLEGAP